MEASLERRCRSSDARAPSPVTGPWHRCSADREPDLRWPNAVRVNLALRISAGSEDVEEGPVGFVGVEERPDGVVGEAAESEGGGSDAFDQVTCCFGESVEEAGVVPVDGLGVPAEKGASQPSDFRRPGRVG